MTLNVIWSWNYYFFFAFNINKVTKIITPQNSGDPQRKEFHSPEPLGTKKSIPRGMKFGEELKTLVGSRNVLLVNFQAIFFL